MWYFIVVSLVYTVLYLIWPEAAEASTVAFIAALLLPAVWWQSRLLRRRD